MNYATWLLEQITGLRRARRLASYARYRASEKGQQRTRRYNEGGARMLASRRYRESHCRGPESYQVDGGFGRGIRWTGLTKVDPEDRAAAMLDAKMGRGMGGASAAERLVMSMGINPAAIHADDGGAAFNAIHAHVAKPFSSDHARRFWQKKADHAAGIRGHAVAR